LFFFGLAWLHLDEKEESIQETVHIVSIFVFFLSIRFSDKCGGNSLDGLSDLGNYLLDVLFVIFVDRSGWG